MTRKAIAATVQTKLTGGQILADVAHVADPVTGLTSAKNGLSGALVAADLTSCLVLVTAAKTSVDAALATAGKDFLLTLDTGTVATLGNLDKLFRQAHKMAMGSGDLT